MRRYWIYSISFSFLALLLSVSSCGKRASNAAQEDLGQVSNPNAKQITIQVPTAKCSSCETTIGKAASSVEGVTAVKVSAKNHTAQVTYLEGKTTPDAIRQKIALAGYTADNVARDNAAYEKLDGCCK